MQVWRVSFALGAIPLAFMIYYRIFRLRESAVWVKRTGTSRSAETGLLFRWLATQAVATQALTPGKYASELQATANRLQLKLLA